MEGLYVEGDDTHGGERVRVIQGEPQTVTPVPASLKS